MKLLMAFDSFKGTLTSLEAGNIACDAAQAVGYDSEVQVVSDGGEGLVDAFVYSNPAKLLEVCTVDPLFREMKADFAISDETAVIECASAAGLCLVPEEKRDPKVTTTFGVGLMIKAAVENGARKIILGLGGSATNDGGTGMAAALGAVFRDQDGKEFVPTGGTLGKIAEIDISKLKKTVGKTKFIACCDVTNPLIGENGASRIYAPQKGADSVAVDALEKNMEHYAAIVGDDIAVCAGSGAAGGLGAAVRFYFGGELAPGFATLAPLIGLEEKICNADIVLTGEGCTDNQTNNGKLPAGVAGLCRKHGKRCIVISGAVKGKPRIDGAERIIPTSYESSMPTKEIAAMRLYETVKQLLEEIKK
ncbi:glycerate kinase [Ruminococcus sp. CAG:382]|nr:glycerate kinase [Ruminococcus sp. CAG:382]